LFLDDQQLQAFFRNMRTQYVKIRAIKTGQAATLLSERDREIFNTFTFLDSHVKRVVSRESFKFKIQEEKKDRSVDIAAEESAESLEDKENRAENKSEDNTQPNQKN